MANIDFSKPQAQEPQPVPALSIKVNEDSISDYLALSDSLPLLVLFEAAQDQSSLQLAETLEQAVKNYQGRLLLLRVDSTESPKLGQAFDLKSLPSVFGLLRGQPAPLFVGNQPKEQIDKVLQKVLEVAEENKLTGLVRADPKLAQPEQVLSENHKKAFEAIDLAEYDQALAHYEKALLENPNDSLAEAGIAQVKLLKRLKDQDLKALVEATPVESELLQLKADALVATGAAGSGFQILLDVFASADKPTREVLRLKMVELFLVVGNDNPEVIQARRNLSLLLF